MGILIAFKVLYVYHITKINIQGKIASSLQAVPYLDAILHTKLDMLQYHMFLLIKLPLQDTLDCRGKGNETEKL
jgi:hypothetical protein